MRSPRSSSSVSLLAPVSRVGVGGALLGCGTGRVLLERMTGLESLLAAKGRAVAFSRPQHLLHLGHFSPRPAAAHRNCPPDVYIAVQ